MISSNIGIELGRVAATQIKKNNINLLDETVAQLPLLVQINKFGFITVDSQDGVIKRGSKIPSDVKLFHKAFHKVYDKLFKQNDVTDAQYKEASKQWDSVYVAQGGTYHKGVQLSQRSYLIGVMEKNDADVFVHMLNKTDKVAYTSRIPVTYNTGNSPGVVASPDLLYSRLNNEVIASTGLHACACDSEKQIRAHIDTCLREVLPEELYRKITTNDKKHLVLVNCFDARHGRKSSAPDGLFTDVINALKQMNKTRLI